MPVQNLLDINTDKLFEDHTISEIIETQKKLQTEIERKREELRTMVGYVKLFPAEMKSQFKVSYLENSTILIWYIVIMLIVCH
jgi:hypothetical protein